MSILAITEVLLGPQNDSQVCPGMRLTPGAAEQRTDLEPQNLGSRNDKRSLQANTSSLMLAPSR
jgi:hypothetical protein